MTQITCGMSDADASRHDSSGQPQDAAQHIFAHLEANMDPRSNHRTIRHHEG